MNILIIEDEQYAALALRLMIESLNDEHTVLDTLTSNAEVKKWLVTHAPPDLIFSDIELLDGPVFNGFKEVPPQAPIIFTTAYDHYMAEAFETTGISYLLKPYTKEELEQAMQKLHLLKRFKAPDVYEQMLNQLETLGAEKAYKKRLTIKKASGSSLLPVENIVTIAMVKGVLRVYDIEGKEHLLTQSLSELVDQLNPEKFQLINRSEGIAWQHVDRLEGYGQDRLAIFMIGQKEAIISSASRTPRLRRWLEG